MVLMEMRKIYIFNRRNKNLKMQTLVLTMTFVLICMLSSVNVRANSSKLVWSVPPILEYEFIYHCCGFSTENHGGEYIDSITGLVLDEPPFIGGHGPLGRGWVYDPELSLLGFGGIGNYSGISLLPTDEWADLFAQWGGQYRLMMVQLVDSSMRNVTEHGNEFLSDNAYSGKFAVMYYNAFVTDFIYDGGSTLGGAVLEYDSIPMHIGESWGFIDINGRVVIPFIFEHIIRIDDDTAFARYDGRYGILNVTLTIANFEQVNRISPATGDYIFIRVAIFLFMAIVLTRLLYYHMKPRAAVQAFSTLNKTKILQR
jgi:hypothetical protein